MLVHNILSPFQTASNERPLNFINFIMKVITNVDDYVLLQLDKFQNLRSKEQAKSSSIGCVPYVLPVRLFSVNS